MSPHYPLCHRHGLIRETHKNSGLVISTSALHQLLGEKLYQEAVKKFTYNSGSGPTPQSVEAFLKTVKDKL